MSDFREYFSETKQAIDSIPLASLEKLRDQLREVAAQGSTLWVAGNGGSAATSSHFVADLAKTAKGFTGNSIRTIALHELQSLQTAYANDISFEEAMSLTLYDFMAKGDQLLILSVSGRSPNLLKAQRSCQKLGMKSMCIVGARGSKLARACDASVQIQSEDFQVVENAHVILMHWLARTL